ncbi:Zn(2+)-responsive transcriptional regulator [Larsenimonas rhizosphaerae]|uniref:Zn(2+)-responsive transcriptional regulator n=1 Tax=Larsenimonas rhizosphaerae TaxID=2944682 RepID=A0AA41ZDC1_9GAMM|nr:Zn(2+)-responsive transcriptional regulator [Larsenimonas rhizosphaerae]MCM2130504.1 Zn(2+)-responsive transcriptional regulator [Larsenimonas rhizosphaerae]MCX2523209.1 Zn(2+)-responsive transcriptional regulator [Larsenimonas rhizosphaerae]
MIGLKRGELARESGLSVETIRYYEQQDLLLTPTREPNGYRRFDPANIERLAFIQRAKHMGFSLKDIAELLTLEVNRDAHTCEEVKAIARTKQREIKARMSELSRMHDALSLINERCCGGTHAATHCTILTALADGERPGAPHEHDD